LVAARTRLIVSLHLISMPNHVGKNEINYKDGVAL